MLWRQTFTSFTLPLDFGPAPQSTSSRTCQRQAGESSLSINPDKSEGCHDHSTDSEELRPHCHLGFIHIRGTFDGYQEYVMLPFLISCSERLKKLERPDTTLRQCEHWRRSVLLRSYLPNTERQKIPPRSPLERFCHCGGHRTQPAVDQNRHPRLLQRWTSGHGSCAQHHQPGVPQRAILQEPH